MNTHADQLFTVADSYALSTSVWDAKVSAYEKSAIYTDDFIYNILGFDPMMWNVIDGKLVKR